MNMASAPRNAADAGLAIARALAAEHIPYALGGAVQGAALKRDYVRGWIADMLGPDDERIATWDRVSKLAPTG